MTDPGAGASGWRSGSVAPGGGTVGSPGAGRPLPPSAVWVVLTALDPTHRVGPAAVAGWTGDDGARGDRRRVPAAYEERLRPPWWLWVVVLGLVGMLAVAYGAALDPWVGWLILVVLGGIVAVALWRSSPVVRVDELVFRAGPARLPLRCVGDVAALDPGATRAVRGPDADVRAPPVPAQLGRPPRSASRSTTRRIPTPTGWCRPGGRRRWPGPCTTRCRRVARIPRRRDRVGAQPPREAARAGRRTASDGQYGGEGRGPDDHDRWQLVGPQGDGDGLPERDGQAGAGPRRQAASRWAPRWDGRWPPPRSSPSSTCS